MTDYWSPARWDGIAEKNGFVLLVDVYGTSQSGYKKTKQGFTPDYSKIEALKATINDKAASQNEKEVSQKIIDKMYTKQKESTVIIEEYPTFSQGNPKGCNWHIEKNGVIIAKGKGAYQCDGYLFNSYREETMKKVNSFIDKIESKISSTEQLEAVQEEVIKMVTKPVEVVTTVNNFVKDQTIIKLNSGFTGGHYKGELLQLVEVRTFNNRTLYTFVKLGKKYQQLKRYGASNNTLMLDAKNIEKWLTDGSISTMELKEVAEVTYKTVYKKVSRKGQEENLLSGEVVETVQTGAPKNAANTTKENKQTTIIKDESIQVEMKLNDKLNGIELYFTGKPSEGTRELLKANSFRWSKYSSCWYTKQSEKSLLFAESLVSAYNDTITEEYEEVEEVVTNNDITETIQPTEEILINESALIGRKVFGQWGVMAGWDNGTITGETIYNEVVIKWEDGHLEYFNISDLVLVHENTSLDPVGVYLLPVDNKEPKTHITASEEANQVNEPITAEQPMNEPEQQEATLKYNCHFKTWYLEPEEIETRLNALNIPYVEAMEKYIFTGITEDQYNQVKQLSNKNGSILFDDMEPIKTNITAKENKNGKVLDFLTRFKAKQEKKEMENMTTHFIDNILPYLNNDELIELQKIYNSKNEKELDALWKRLMMITAVRRAKDEMLKQN
jgi:hypothetical protein